ncbi:MAG TPA: hypothetical protein VJX28_07930, partial [Chthoniobacterales bacterium]|nr:hypothetical protein [Chthoniobacterales bacterium]
MKKWGTPQKIVLKPVLRVSRNLKIAFCIFPHAFSLAPLAFRILNAFPSKLMKTRERIESDRMTSCGYA